jgi:hypothetical protein
MRNKKTGSTAAAKAYPTLQGLWQQLAGNVDRQPEGLVKDCSSTGMYNMTLSMNGWSCSSLRVLSTCNESHAPASCSSGTRR